MKFEGEAAMKILPPGTGLGRRVFMSEAVRCAALIAAIPGLVACGRASAPRNFSEYRECDALDLATLVRRGEAEPRELLEIAIGAAERLNPRFNFMAIPLYEYARRRVREGIPRAPLAGVPFLLKDLGIHLEGTRMTSGSRLFRNEVSDHTSTIVKRYQEAGLVVFGRTTSPEFGATPTTESLLFGPTRNPWNPALSSGGSSGGSAVAVAAGVTPVASASDGGGSIRIPASCCGLFGLKPSRGRTPYGPVDLEGGGGLSVLHVVSRSVRDSAVLLDLSSGPEPGSPQLLPPPSRSYLRASTRDPRRLRIAVVEDTGVAEPLHEDCRTALLEAAELCARLGHEVETYPGQKLSFEKLPEALGTVMSVRKLRILQKLERERGRPISERELEPINFEILQQSRAITAVQYARARATFHETAREVTQSFAGWDLVLNPTMASPPPPLGHISLDQDMERFSRVVVPYAVYTALYNITGQPAMSVPLYWNREQLPIGVMFSAPRNDEMTLFQLAGQLERARPWFGRVPSLA